MILEFSNEAESDLERIADYIAEANPRRALSFIRELRSKCQDLIDALGIPVRLTHGHEQFRDNFISYMKQNYLTDAPIMSLGPAA